jgi:hypothetical protein
MSVYTMNEIADKVRPIAIRYGAEKIYLFGSYARGEATDSSDIDLYVEFLGPIGLNFCSFFADIEESFGKEIDIVTKDGLYNPATLETNKPFIQRIREECRCIYGE